MRCILRTQLPNLTQTHFGNSSNCISAASCESSLRATAWQYNAGTHATRRNIAVAIPLAFKKRLQQHMRSTTLVREFACACDGLAIQHWDPCVRVCINATESASMRLTSESRLAFGKCAPDLYTSRPTYIKDTTRRNTTPSAAAAAAAAARERLSISGARGT